VVRIGGAKVERRDFNFKIKSVNADGTFVGMGAVYNNVDLGGDKILPGAFTRTLNSRKGAVPILWQHQPDNPIGSAIVTEIPAGLQVQGSLELSDPTARKAYTFMKAGVTRGLSIGYETVQSTMDGDVRNLTELKLYEISCVTFPMNESATISSVKSLSDEDRTKHFKNIDFHRKSIDLSQRAIRESLKALFDGGLDDDELDDRSLLEDDESDDESKAFLVELRKLAAQTESLVTE
jgi:hypothetical protein